VIGFIGAVLLVVSVAAKWFNLWGQFPAALPFRSQSAMAVDSGVGCRSRCGNQERSSGIVVVIGSSAPAFAQWDDPPQDGNGQPDDAGHNHGGQVAYHVGDYEVRG